MEKKLCQLLEADIKRLDYYQSTIVDFVNKNPDISDEKLASFGQFAGRMREMELVGRCLLSKLLATCPYKEIDIAVVDWHLKVTELVYDYLQKIATDYRRYFYLFQISVFLYFLRPPN